MRVSVAMAAYHGEAYIEAQLASILPQLGPEDEVIVSDDCPGGKTEEIVRRMAAADERIRYVAGPGRGVLANFAQAISLCGGDVIFLSDQDDIWLPDKAVKVKEAIENGALLVLHDACVTDADLHPVEPSFFAAHGSKPGLWSNLLRNSFMGCCMAFRRELCRAILPFPEDIPMHDQWIGLIATRRGHVAFLKEPLLLYRRHGGNVTGGSASFAARLRWRWKLSARLLERFSLLARENEETGNG
ncbi:MAG TPA: glycosyltransferase family 2 protein [Candidatus Fimivicinus intestinavium]|nr:glycosyltransferase family 2 protein [Candidatus Fimivicinus intestinavium]